MTSPRAPVAQLAVVFAAVIAIRLVNITQEVFTDELYHLLAARQYLLDGSLAIGVGEPYERARSYTLLVAGLFRLFGESPAVGRLPAVLCAGLTVALLFWWLGRRGQPLAAWVAAGALALAPGSLQLTQIRFYALHQLLLLAATIGVERLVAEEPPRRRAYWLAAGTVAALFLAYRLQVTTIIAAAGLALYATIALAVRAVARGAPWTRLAASAAVLAGVAAAVLLLTPVGEHVATFARFSPGFAQDNAGEPRFYHWLMMDRYPTVWTLMPFVVLAAFAQSPRLAGVSVTVFGTALVAHSALPWKGARYLEYAMPHFFVLVGLAVAWACPRAVTAVESRLGHARAWGRPLVIAAAVVVVVLNGAVPETLRLLTRDPAYTHPELRGYPVSWSAAAAVLQPVIDSGAIVISTDDLKARYYLGRQDYVLSATDLSPPAGRQPEFWVQPFFGSPVVSTAESLERLRRCHARGVIVGQRISFAQTFRVPGATAQWIDANAAPVALPPRSGLAAFAWAGAADSLAAECPG